MKSYAVTRKFDIDGSGRLLPSNRLRGIISAQ
jgi:hypothetical protein